MKLVVLHKGHRIKLRYRLLFVKVMQYIFRSKIITVRFLIKNYEDRATECGQKNLRENIVHNMPMYIGKTISTTLEFIGQSFMVDSE